MRGAVVVLLLVTTFFHFLVTCVVSAGGLREGENRDRILLSEDEPQTRVVGGSSANKERFPYYVALVGPSASSAICGGTLIASDVVLTAAHCDV